MKEAGGNGDNGERQSLYTFVRLRDLKKGASFTGTYDRTERGKKFGNVEYYVKTENTIYVIPGSQPGIGLLNKKMKEVPIGSKVEITYGGKEIIQKGERAGTEANLWKVLYDDTSAKPATAAAAPKATVAAKKPAPPVIEDDATEDADDEEIVLW